MTSGFFQDNLNEFLKIFTNSGWVLGSILFSIFGIASAEIANKFYGDESTFKEIISDIDIKNIKKPKDIFEAIIIFFIYGILGGVFGAVVLTFAAFALDLVIKILYYLLGKLI